MQNDSQRLILGAVPASGLLTYGRDCNDRSHNTNVDKDI
jgi:hypothetical protein